MHWVQYRLRILLLVINYGLICIDNDLSDIRLWTTFVCENAMLWVAFIWMVLRNTLLIHDPTIIYFKLAIRIRSSKLKSRRELIQSHDLRPSRMMLLMLTMSGRLFSKMIFFIQRKHDISWFISVLLNNNLWVG